MSCLSTPPAPLRCPSFEESLYATAALAPQGRAWPVSDGGGTVARYLAWLNGLAGIPAGDEWPAGFVQAGWFAALSAIRNYIENRLCDLRHEFFCVTQTETREQWMREYGLPDYCDPFPDLCAKVSGLGGARCDYYAEIAARIGWVIECADVVGCGARMGCAEMGYAVMGPRTAGGIVQITVDLGQSESYEQQITPQSPYMGALVMGNPLFCAADFVSLRCLLDRVVHAHIDLTYRTVDPAIYLIDADGALLTDAGGALLTYEA